MNWTKVNSVLMTHHAISLIGYAVCAGIAAIPGPGARVVAGAAACVIFILDLMN